MAMETRGRRDRYVAIRHAAVLLSVVAAPLACGASKEPQLFPRPFQIIAHRGASAYAPENTLPAFARAHELGAFEVELDVQVSRDDVVVIFHDPELETKTGRRGRVRDYSAAELREMEIGSWFDRTHPEVSERFAGTRLMTLAELFDAFGDRLYYHVEFKAADAELPSLALAEVDRVGLNGRVHWTSFLFEQLERARALDAAIPITLLVRDAARLRAEVKGVTAGQDEPLLLPIQKRWVDRAARAGFDQVGFPSHDLGPEIVAYARGKGLQVRAWRIRSDVDMRHAIAVGCNGMTTNWPERLIRELVEYTGSSGNASRLPKSPLPSPEADLQQPATAR
jgi:glycerophosphoryl diester phosphodiesterase